ncbi:MAG TPA: amidase [Kribbellaceae bacterium]|nr:amidase [Kribbellaceae bacterium]
MSTTRPAAPRAGTSPSVAAVEALQARAAEIDPLIRSICTPNPDAAADAARLDAELADGRRRGPLHGVPVLVKDNVDTAGLATTAGSLALADVPPPARDAPIVARLRAAGCVVLGKTNLSEWANFRGATSSSGWSGYGGLTRNPYALNRSAGGSSSGSGAAVAAGLARIAVGTETNGSIVCPAALNGVVGIKPSVGLVPQQGIVPISHSQDTAGPMAATVREAAELLTVLAGDGSDYAAHCDGTDLSGLRIGVPRGTMFWGSQPGLDATTEQSLELLSAAGATLVDPVELTDTTSYEDQLVVLYHELKIGMASYLATRAGAPASLADVIAFNREHAGTELLHFGQELFERSEATNGLAAPEYVAARLACLNAGRRGIDEVMRKHELDALVMPGYPPAWTIDLVNGDQVNGGNCSMHAALAGYPLLSVPSGTVAGLPVSITFGGGYGSDGTLVRLAHAFEVGRVSRYGPLPEPEYIPWL